jgi:hypothetical protein
MGSLRKDRAPPVNGPGRIRPYTVGICAISFIGSQRRLSIDGQEVDHVAYRKSLYEELALLNQQIAILQGPYEEQGQAVT